MVIWVGAKGANRSMYYCIEPAESLEWSLTWARRGMVPGVLSGLAVGGVVFLLPHELNQLQGRQEWIFFLGWAAIGLAVGELLGGLRTRTFKGKTFPNQGIRLSLTTAVFVGLNAVWLVTFAMVLEIAGRFDNPFKDLLGYLAVLFAIFFLWLVGLRCSSTMSCAPSSVLPVNCLSIYLAFSTTPATSILCSALVVRIFSCTDVCSSTWLHPGHYESRIIDFDETPTTNCGS